MAFRCLFAGYFRWRIYNVERVPKEGPVILASNHASYIDPPFIGAAIPREISYFARASLFRFPVFGSLLREWNAMPVDRDGGRGAGMRTLLDRIGEGWPVILFPEGTRTPTGDFLPAESGVGMVIIKTAAPVVPVRVFGSYEAWGRHMKIPRPRRVMAKFGEPMRFEALREEARRASKKRLKEIYQLTADETMRAIRRLEPCQDIRQF